MKTEELMPGSVLNVLHAFTHLNLDLSEQAGTRGTDETAEARGGQANAARALVCPAAPPALSPPPPYTGAAL